MYTLEQLRRHRDSIHAIGKRYGVRSIQLFGSVVRGEAGPRSDIDFLVDIELAEASWTRQASRRMSKTYSVAPLMLS